MFTALHALAQKTTLLITVAAEGDKLRVNITPSAGDKEKQLLRPLSLVGTAEELNADFAQAIAIWQAPKQSILEQAQAAAGASDDDDDEGDDTPPAASKPAAAKTAAKPAAKKTGKPNPPAKAAAKPAAKTAKASDARTVLNPAAQWPFPTDKNASAEQSAEGAPATEPTQPDAPDDQAPAAPEATNPPDATTPAKDDFTLQLF